MSKDVKDQMRVQRLIAEATARIGNQNQLARAIGYPVGNVNDWAHGRRACPIQAQALMAEIAGLDAEEVALYALIEGERNPQRKESLLRVLGKGFAHTSAGASCVTFASALWAFDTHALLHTMYRLVKSNAPLALRKAT